MYAYMLHAIIAHYHFPHFKFTFMSTGKDAFIIWPLDPTLYNSGSGGSQLAGKKSCRIGKYSLPPPQSVLCCELLRAMPCHVLLHHFGSMNFVIKTSTVLILRTFFFMYTFM